MDITDVVARNVRRYREARGISQRDLGGRFGSSGSHVNKIEDGKVPNIGIVTLAGIARALNVTITDLVEGAEAIDAGENSVSDQALRVASLLRDAKMEKPEDFLTRLVRLPADAQLLVGELLRAVEYYTREKAKRERRFRLSESNLTEKLNILGKVAEDGERYGVDKEDGE